MFRRRRKDDGPAGRETFDGLRTQVISLDPERIGLSPTERFPHVWGCLMEQGIDNEVASLVSLADGSTSLYTSTGGGVIGGGDHPQVAEASLRFLDAMDALVDIFEPTEELPVPGPDEVRFNVLTHQGRRTASAMYDDVAQPAHSIHPLFATAQDVLTELRLIDEGTRG